MAVDAGTITVKVKAEVDRAEAAITKDEPVIVGHAALWLLAMVGEFFVGHTHLITQSQWDGLQSFFIPAVTSLLLAGSAWAVRSVVTPAGRALETVADSAVKVVNAGESEIGKVVVPTTTTPSAPAETPPVEPAPTTDPAPAAPAEAPPAT